MFFWPCALVKRLHQRCFVFFLGLVSGLGFMLLSISDLGYLLFPALSADLGHLDLSHEPIADGGFCLCGSATAGLLFGTYSGESGHAVDFPAEGEARNAGPSPSCPSRGPLKTARTVHGTVLTWIPGCTGLRNKRYCT